MREPYTYDFNILEIHLVGRAFHKQLGVGLTLRGDRNIKGAQKMLAEELITLTATNREEKSRGPGFVMQLTDKGKECWVNFGRKAGQLNPIYLEKR